MIREIEIDDKEIYIEMAEEFYHSEAVSHPVPTEHFEKENDGYYYYDEVLKGGNKITFCNYIFIPKEINLRSGEKYIISFVVETLESKYDIGIWKKS